MSIAAYDVITSLFGLVGFAVHVAFLIVSLTLIRSRRPDAFLPFTMAAALFLLQTVVNLIGPPVVRRFADAAFAAGGSLEIFSVMFGFGTILSTIAWVLLMIGIVKIASPPQEFSPNRPPGG
jgi:uncharacterized membrane protein YuzA (DUF378 family)